MDSAERSKKIACVITGTTRNSCESSSINVERPITPFQIANDTNVRGRRYIINQRDKRTLTLPKVPPCKFCGAYRFYKESDIFCCSKGEIILAENILPQYLVNLITGTDPKSKDFQNQIRTYNNAFSYTSIGMHCDENYERRDRGIYTVKVQGQVYHFLGDLVPHDVTKNMAGIQFYFFDPEHQVEHRMAALPRLDPSIVRDLVILMQNNPYSQFLKQALMLDNIEQYNIIIRSDPGIDQRRYNRPTSNEVVGIWIKDEYDEENNMNSWDIRVYAKSGKSYIVQYYYACYDPLQYVFIHSQGEPGWNSNIARVGYTITKIKGIASLNATNYSSFDAVIDAEEEGVLASRLIDTTCGHESSSAAKRSRKRKIVSCREYYVYKLQQRPNDRSYLLRFGRLLQQYVVDNYIKLESMRFAYLKLNQKKLRREHYQGIMYSIISGVPVRGKIGTMVYLPATFIGGPRDMRQWYLDSMALEQEYGRPDLFLTMTCNLNWPEIKERLEPGEEAYNRPYLIARVFKAKFNILNEKIMSGEIFGQVSSVVHVIEFQKRGSSHAHFLIILQPVDKYMNPEAYDRIGSAELPNKDEDPYFYSLVVKHMMHGPCGELTVKMFA